MKNKKGNLWNLVPAGLAFIVIGFIFTVGANLMMEMKADGHVINSSAVNYTLDYAGNSSEYAAKGMQKITNWLPLIGLIIAAGIIIQVLMGSLAARRK